MKKKLNICFYAPVWPISSPPNGITTYVNNIQKPLSFFCENVYVISSQKGKATKLTNNIYFTFDSTTITHKILQKIKEKIKIHDNKSEGFLIKKTLEKIKSKNEIDIIEIEESFGWAKHLSNLPKTKLVLRLHGPHFLMLDLKNEKTITNYDKKKIELEGEAIKSADYVTAPSKSVLNEVRKFYNLELKNSCVIPNPIIIPKHHWNYELCDKNKILFIGRFDFIKGADILLDTFEYLSKSYPKLILQFVGPKSELTDKHGFVCSFDEYIYRHLSPATRERVEYLGYQNPENIAKLREKAFATIITSRYETFGYNLLEAIAHGCPVVTTSSGGLAEIAEHNISAIYTDSTTQKDLSNSIKIILDNHDLAKKLAKGAAKRAKIFEADLIAKKTIEIYSSLQ